MKYVFFGTPRFAAIILRKLVHAGMVPAALVCNPDRAAGRKKIVSSPLTKQLILEQKLNSTVLQPEKLDISFLRKLEDLHADLFIVAAYANIISKSALAIPRHGTMGVHPSLLPHYRGASPIQSVILAGENETGTTLYTMDEKTDHGPIIAQAKLNLDALTTDYLALEEKLADLSAELLIRTVPSFIEGKIAPQAQDETRATYTKKFVTADGFVQPDIIRSALAGDTAKAEEIVRKINALGLEPGVWTTHGGKRVKLLQGSAENGKLVIKKTQKEGDIPRSQGLS